MEPLDETTRERVASIIGDAVNRSGRGSRARLAEACEVTAATVTKWTQGHTIPEPAKWPTIESELDLEPGAIATACGFDVTESVVSLRSELHTIRLRVEEIGEELRGLLRQVLDVVSEDPPGDR